MLLLGNIAWTTSNGGIVPPPPTIPDVVSGVPVGGGYNPSQGLYPRPPSKKEISKARARLGLQDGIAHQEAAAVIAEVAARQAKAKEQDKQKQLEELSRELQLRNITWESGYLEALTAERERLLEIVVAEKLLLRSIEEAIGALLLIAAKQEIEAEDELLNVIIGQAAKLGVEVSKVVDQIRAEFERRLTADKTVSAEPEVKDDSLEKRKVIQEQFIGAVEKIVKELVKATVQ